MARGKRHKLTERTPKEDKFCREYAINGGNGAQAYLKAYPASKKHDAAYRAHAGAKLLKKPNIKSGIEEYRGLMAEVVQEKREEFKIDAEAILRELHAVAFQDPRALFQWGTKKVPKFARKTGEPILDPKTGEQAYDDVPYMMVKDSDALSPDDVRTIVGIEQSISQTGHSIVNVKRADKLKALQLLGQHAKLFTQKVEHGGEVKTGPLQLVVTRGEADA